MPPDASAIWIIWPTIQGLALAALVLAYLRLPFEWELLAYLGKISYSLYVWHTLVFLVAVKLDQPLMVWPATLLLSMLSYAVIEEPFLKLRVRYVKTPENIRELT